MFKYPSTNVHLDACIFQSEKTVHKNTACAIRLLFWLTKCLLLTRLVPDITVWTLKTASSSCPLFVLYISCLLSSLKLTSVITHLWEKRESDCDNATFWCWNGQGGQRSNSLLHSQGFLTHQRMLIPLGILCTHLKMPVLKIINNKILQLYYIDILISLTTSKIFLLI